ncbi:MAG: hypothetical protein IT282_16905 [Bacteroidetes bacterium]|nr:hypothetical protein [Bacteroidota bacterium]
MRVVLAPLLFILAAAVMPSQLETDQAGRDNDSAPSFTPKDSAAEAFANAVRRLTSRELEARKLHRLTLQRRGYAAILHDVLRRDALGALFATIRTKAQLDIHLPQNTLYAYIPVRTPDHTSQFQVFSPPASGPMKIPLFEDKSFPEDPWRK